MNLFNSNYRSLCLSKSNETIHILEGTSMCEWSKLCELVSKLCSIQNYIISHALWELWLRKYNFSQNKPSHDETLKQRNNKAMWNIYKLYKFITKSICFIHNSTLLWRILTCMKYHKIVGNFKSKYTDTFKQEHMNYDAGIMIFKSLYQHICLAITK